MKISRLQRILQLVGILQSSRYCNPEDLASKLNVNRRTIFRDLDTIRKVGIPYSYDEEKGGYKINSSYLLPPLNLNLLEALSLMLVGRNVNAACTLPVRQEMDKASLKVETALPGHIQYHCSTLLKGTSMRCAPHVRSAGQTHSFALLQQAIRQRCKVRLTYDSFYEKKEIITTLSPYHLHFDRRAWYVIGRSSLHNQQRTFKLSRIKKIKILFGRYTPEKSFSIEQYLGNAWAMIPEGEIYHVKLLFSKNVAGNVAEVLWHKTQKLTHHKNGELTFEVDVDGLGEISWWIIGYADQVEVLEPKLLLSRVKQMADKTAKIYK